jgi:hypothetical protein
MPKFFWDTVADRWKAQLEVVSKTTAAAKKSKKYRRKRMVEWKALASIADEIVERVAKHPFDKLELVGRLKDKTPFFRTYKSDVALFVPMLLRRDYANTHTGFGWDRTLEIMQHSEHALPFITLVPLYEDNISDMTRFSAGRGRSWKHIEVLNLSRSDFWYARTCIDRFYLVIAHSEPFRFLPREIKELLFDYVFVNKRDLDLLWKRGL